MPSLPDLPTELLMEIIKYYPELYVEVDARTKGVLSEQYPGNDALRALSQTSRTLRDIYLPVLWERFHSCFTVRNRPKRKIRTRAKMLERRMKGIQKTPYIQPYIRSLSISLSECRMDNWQPMAEFIRVLDLLPNLRELTLTPFTHQMTPVLTTACQGKSYPSILTLTIHDALAPIMHCFPNVETLNLSDGASFALFMAAKEHCKHIHTINNITLSPFIVDLLRDAIPKLKRLSLWSRIRLDTLRLLEGMENLSDLRIRRQSRPVFLEPVLPVEEIIAVAQRVLRTSNAKCRKEVRIQEFEGTRSSDGLYKETLVIAE
ncbi:hypothetical protein C8F04DRAFT_332626 [Mycena alexandri]|uniref:Uncharacterized protein n=1 Tax=Mycena alexandri TaxID=1745969 RepID=A0AAD6T7X8_9AGAR|nr:hypothetical protein C8F04DRAFT_332626 [Mycena alexandri]